MRPSINEMCRVSPISCPSVLTFTEHCTNYNSLSLRCQSIKIVTFSFIPSFIPHQCAFQYDCFYSIEIFVMKQPLSGKTALCLHMGNCHSDQPMYLVFGVIKNGESFRTANHFVCMNINYFDLT